MAQRPEGAPLQGAKVTNRISGESEPLMRRADESLSVRHLLSTQRRTRCGAWCEERAHEIRQQKIMTGSAVNFGLTIPCTKYPKYIVTQMKGGNMKICPFSMSNPNGPHECIKERCMLWHKSLNLIGMDPELKCRFWSLKDG